MHCSKFLFIKWSDIKMFADFDGWTNRSVAPTFPLAQMLIQSRPVQPLPTGTRCSHSRNPSDSFPAKK